MNERGKRLGRVLAETTLGAQVLFTAGENVTGARLRQAYNEAAEAVATAVAAEDAPLLATVERALRSIEPDGDDYGCYVADPILLEEAWEALWQLKEKA